MASVLRGRRGERRYVKHRRQLAETVCEFCDFTAKHEQVVEAGTHFWVVATKFVYDMWDSFGVDDHLMLVPKRHIRSLAEFSPSEQREFFKLAAKYEAKNYSVYARSVHSKTKSITHQHTHLIKLDNRAKRLIFYLKKPHLLFMR
jgi:diadenosine tetraphosphate (Ap4A) HIT family hydrolase